MSETPKGVVAIITDPQGRVMASHADFALNRPGGFSLQDAQQQRAGEGVRRQLIKCTCAEYIAAQLGEYDCRKIVDGLRRDGWRVEYVTIGHDE